MFGSMDLAKRIEELEKFKSGKARFLVVTDLCARGIDIPDVELVINYDFPTNMKTFVHRCGRTARIEKSGKAISMVTRDELMFMIKVDKILDKREMCNSFDNENIEQEGVDKVQSKQYTCNYSLT